MSRQAVVTTGSGKVAVQEAPLPEPGPGQIIVRPVAVGLNPTDCLDGVTAVGAIIGCDYAGVVEKLGPDVDTVKVGDSFAGFVHGSVATNHKYGAFASKIIAFPDIGLVLPKSLSYESAAILGVGVTTVGQAMRETLKIPDPVLDEARGNSKGDFVLIYGGTTATGMLAIQFAALSGKRVITCCSEKSFDRVKKLGAEAAFDYKNDDCAANVRKYTYGKLSLTFDCISQTSSFEICLAALGTSGGTIAATLPPKPDELKDQREDVKIIPVLSYKVVGESFRKGDDSEMMEAGEKDRRESAAWWKIAGPIIAAGKIELSEIDVREGGLEGIGKGLEDGRSGSKGGASEGGKMVYKL